MAVSRSPASRDFEKAVQAPRSVFETPEQILIDDVLTPDQKVEILRRWQYDAAELSVAIEEGMPGAENDLLRRILLALDELTGGVDSERTGPSKQHGMDRRAVAKRRDG